MKLFISILFIVIASFGVFAQVPEKISYQAIIRTIDGDILASSSVGLKIGIIQQSTSGQRIYEESHVPVTNENGLISLHIGTGVVTMGDFAQIDWSNGPYYLETQMDLDGGSNYSITGLTELLSVPYALYAKTAGALVATDGEYLLKSKIISFQSSRNISANDVGNTIECTSSAVLQLTSNFNNMEIGDTINLEAHNGAVLTIGVQSGVQLNYVDAGIATFKSELGSVRFGLLRKTGVNSYIISGQ